ncbi:hypothetical protein CONCODRAFT_9340 [Conidiobolus coronatus NRRL 28638]|uniref:Uncharacterized protein n=1 Tax=Conidiobolus coronatus (strain ATCC 28846 / CBS 209.66 / NRRL 28638) TaxID=796925 RepID=A0A137P007_CONC2|nr:hypothetical protein CONCODRAFT_9340 [Conidiobolus coronatus NRRL 28638]|eukprot:KXN68410.1 hypothetical protein CONCODRAFT_9340 [Conidiobolus coronatus NRRL 28638]
MVAPNFEMDCLYLGSLIFTIITFLDFILIETILKLGVFTLGKKWLRCFMIFSLVVEAMFWNPLYYFMLIEQNYYWMSDRLKRNLYIALGFFCIWVGFVGVVLVLVGLEFIHEKYMEIVHIFDMVLLVQLVSTEIFINLNVYKISKVKIRSMSIRMWRTVQLSLFVCTFCTALDIVFIVLENLGRYDIAYQLKTSSFALKIVFECMCFQFIKGLVFSLH